MSWELIQARETYHDKSAVETEDRKIDHTVLPNTLDENQERAAPFR
jgi:hypothetical protein